MNTSLHRARSSALNTCGRNGFNVGGLIFNSSCAWSTMPKQCGCCCRLPPMRWMIVLLPNAATRSRIVAAAGLTRSQRPKPLVGPGVAIHVIEP